MKKIVACCFLVMCVYSGYSQFIVKQNGDTLYCEIKKIGLYKIKLNNRPNNNEKKEWDARELSAFLFNGTLWKSHIFLNGIKKNERTNQLDTLYTFLPPFKENRYYKLNNYEYISVTSNGYTTFYEITEDYNNRYSYSVLIHNDLLGFQGIPIKQNLHKDPPTVQYVRELLKAYTSDNIILVRELEKISFKAKREQIRLYMANYLGRYLTTE